MFVDGILLFIHCVHVPAIETFDFFEIFVSHFFQVRHVRHKQDRDRGLTTATGACSNDMRQRS